MPESNNAVYLICRRGKGQQKKHIAVCARCRWQSNCESYQTYCREESRLHPDPLLTLRNKPFIKSALRKHIRVELKEIISILACYESGNKSRDRAETEAALNTDFYLEHLIKELSHIKSLF